MAKKKEKDTFAIERYRIISEVNKVLMKKSIKHILEPVIKIFLVGLLAHIMLNCVVLWCIEGNEIQFEGPVEVGEALMAAAGAFVVIITMSVLYFISLKNMVINIYGIYREEYRTLYICGLDKSEMLSEVAHFYTMPLILSGIAGVVIVPLFDGVNTLGDCVIVYMFIVIVITLYIISKMFKKNFAAIIGTSDSCDISRVDGKCKLIPWLSAEENVALPYRMMRGRDSVRSNEEISYIARDLKIDGILKGQYSNLTQFHKVVVMILRAYSVAGRSMVLEEGVIQYFNTEERAEIDRIMGRIMNPLISEEYVPNNVVKKV